tara:strand:+ start:2205 stop:2438 length:234 start_codon:yes stop_codon:yes gene_type:complete
MTDDNIDQITRAWMEAKKLRERRDIFRQMQELCSNERREQGFDLTDEELVALRMWASNRVCVLEANARAMLRFGGFQ